MLPLLSGQATGPEGWSGVAFCGGVAECGHREGPRLHTSPSCRGVWTVELQPRLVRDPRIMA